MKICEENLLVVRKHSSAGSSGTWRPPCLSLMLDYFIIDGEAVGDFLYAFDLLRADHGDLRNRSYREWLDRLTRFRREIVQIISLPWTLFSPCRNQIGKMGRFSWR